MRDDVTPNAIRALDDLNSLGLHPIPEPCGDLHHTDEPITAEDAALGGSIAFFLGGLFCDLEDDMFEDSARLAKYFTCDMTSVDIWSRVARALRVHGLCITDAMPKGKQ